MLTSSALKRGLTPVQESNEPRLTRSLDLINVRNNMTFSVASCQKLENIVQYSNMI